MGKQCSSCRQAFPSFDNHLTCAHCRYVAGTCQLDASNPCQALRLVSEDLGQAEEIPPGCQGQICKLGTHHWTTTVPTLDMWLEGSSTSSDLISEVCSINDSEIMELDFIDNSDNVVVSTVREVEVSVRVHQSHLGITTGPNHE